MSSNSVSHCPDNVTDSSIAQRGNALFLILIAVALFAALSYAITQSGRGSGSVAKETDAIAAAQVVQIGADLRAAAQRMVLTGTSVTALQAHAVGDFSNPCTVTDGTCLFTPDGGGLTWPAIPVGALADPNLIYIAMLVPGDGGNGADLIGTPALDGVFAVLGLSEGVCTAINKGLGVSGIPVVDSHWADALPSIVLIQGQPNPPAVCGEVSILALPGAPSPVYGFYQVILER